MRPKFAVVFLANSYEVGHDADVLDQLTLRVTGSACSGQFSSCTVNMAEEASEKGCGSFASDHGVKAATT